MSTEWVMPSNYLILCHPLLLLPSIFPSIRVFSNELALCIRWPVYWSFNFSISLSNEYSGLISCNWLVWSPCCPVLVTQLCLILCDPRDYSPPMSSVHGILQARILEWVAISFSRGSSQPRDWTWVSCIAGRIFTDWATKGRMAWFDLLAVQGTLKSLHKHHSSKASILQCSDFFMVQLSHQYMTTGKIVALTIWTFVSKVMSLLFNTLSRFAIAFLPRSKHLLISWP